MWLDAHPSAFPGLSDKRRGFDVLDDDLTILRIQQQLNHTIVNSMIDSEG